LYIWNNYLEIKKYGDIMKKTNPLVSDDSVQAILQIASAYQKSKILLAACELDIFTILGSESKSSAEVSVIIGTEKRATDRIMNALTALNLLEKKDSKFSNTLGTLRFLVKGQPEFIGNMIHISHLWDRWATLTDCIRLGHAAVYQSINEKSDEWVESFVSSIHWRGFMVAPDVVKLIDLSNVNSLLDIGCGSGLYSMEFLNVKPSLDVTVFDYPKVITQTKKYFEKKGCLDKIKIIQGDILTDDFQKGYDIVFLSQVLQLYSFWESLQILNRVYDTLNFGGTVIIHETLIDEERDAPESSAMLSMNMLVNTLSGDAYTETELDILLKEAWFTDVTKINTIFGTSLMIGKK
jgi:precorrin-6B methylase 2